MSHPDLESDYLKNGYAVIEGAFPASGLASIRSAALRIVDEFDIGLHRSIFSTRDRDQGRDRYFTASSEGIHCFLEEYALNTDGHLTLPKALAINKIGHALHDLDPAFDAFCRQSVLAGILRDIGYHEPVLWQSMYIFKQPRIGGEVRWHQDASYLIAEPGPVVGFWVAVED
ncbi:MAG: phytanoyl-CoA dioxygenase family protein, partial [Lysobacterales bacterium]